MLEHPGPAGFLRLLVVDRGRSGRDTLIAGSMLLMLGDTTFYAFNGGQSCTDAPLTW